MRDRASQSQQPLAPEWLPPDEDLDIITSSAHGGHAVAPRAYPAPVQYTAGYAPARVGSYGQPTPHSRYAGDLLREVSSSRGDVAHGVIESPTYLPAHQVESPTYLPSRPRPAARSTPAPLPEAKVVRTRSASQAAPLPAAPAAPKSASQAAPLPAAPSIQVPAQVPPVAAPQPAPAAAPQVNLGGIDPMLMPIPPELAPPIYSWVRRLALQANLTAADRLLRDALADLTQSLSVSIYYPGADGLFSLGIDEEVPRDAQPIIAVAQARRAVIATHMALVPVTTSTETVAVILLQRNPRQQGYSPVEQIAMLGLARESAAILHHLAVQHIQHASEVKADQGSLYRGEALEAHRNRGHEGVLTNLTPGWVRKTYPILMITLVIASVFAICIHVPTYSSGPALVVFDGPRITAPAPGTVAEVLVTPGSKVKANTPIVRLQAADEEAELAQADTELNDALRTYMFDGQDDNAKQKLSSAVSHQQRAKAKLDSRTIRAKQDGNISDIHIHVGQLLQPGDHIVTLVDDKVEPEIVAFLPGTDRPRIRVGMELQVDLVGYTKSREIAIITSVGSDIVGANEANKFAGATIADSLQLAGSIVIVKARLPSRTFKTEHNVYNYHNGMLAKTEVKVQSKPFLVTLMPALEKYLPD